MKITIIGEFNPFHNGHHYLIEEIKKIYPSSSLSLIMSGDFNQRGIPAVIGKWKRAETALNSGCDLVCEMPVFYTLSPAKEFAAGSVDLAINLGTDILAFGSETGNTELLINTSEKSLNFNENHEIFLKGKRKGMSYSQTLIDILKEDFPNKKIGSNDILGMEYIKAIKKSSANIKPFAIKRLDENYLSAKALRDCLKKGQIDELEKYLPDFSFDIIKNTEKFVFFEDFSKIILYLLTISEKEYLMQIYGANEDMVNRLIKFRKISGDLEEIISLTSGKNFSESRVRRYLISLLIGMKSSEIKKESPIRILSANSKGLSMIKNKTIIKNFKSQNEFDLNLRATNIYNLALNSEINTDYKIPPVIK